MLGLRWGMLRWITQYIKENEEKWEEELNEKLEKERKELEEWNKAKRFEKIEKLKEKWRRNDRTGENIDIDNSEGIKSQRNLSQTESQEEKSLRNLSNLSSPKLSNEKSQQNLSPLRTVRDTNAETIWRVWREKNNKNNTNNKSNTNNINNTSANKPGNTDIEENIKLKPKILTPKLVVENKNNNITTLDDEKTESELVEALDLIERNTKNQVVARNTNIPPEPPESQKIPAPTLPRPNQTTVETNNDGFDGVDDSTLHCKMQVGGLGDAHRVELVASQPPLPCPQKGLT